VGDQGEKNNGYTFKEPMPQETARKVFSGSVQKNKSSILDEYRRNTSQSGKYVIRKINSSETL